MMTRIVCATPRPPSWAPDDAWLGDTEPRAGCLSPESRPILLASASDSLAVFWRRCACPRSHGGRDRGRSNSSDADPMEMDAYAASALCDDGGYLEEVKELLAGS